MTLGTKSSFIFNGQYKEIDYIKTKLKNLVITGTYSLLALKQEEATKNDLEDIARHLRYLIEDKIINKDGIGISAIYSKEIYDIKKNSSAKYYIPLNGSLVQNIINASNITKIEDPYIFEEKESYEEYEILNRKLDKINNIEDTWFSELGQGCIDTIFYSRNIELIKFETIDAKGTSDHSAIYTEFNI